MSTLSSRIFTITDQSKLASSSSTFLFPLFPSHSRSFSRSSRSSILYGRTHVAKPIRASASQLPSAASSVTVENSESESDPSGTLFVIRARNRIGLLQVITGVFKVLGLHVEKATVEFEGDFFVKRFFVTDSHGAKIADPDSLDRIKKALTDAIEDGGTVSMGPTVPPREV
ncbi:glycogen phosphorylase 1-like isoform X1 [Prunus yedoensis var. nudiflora]|uniref:Glycogen phosphorylase 1-like isoform X1 n=1 Tax=Prunus yedoensis var. nudiflora TaxID=2094558 RepID=A0A314ZNC4_PRUYE|nr:glycogen phosphorylase 1-like isoform X1 [Prunus yedoensis var. nudiflora]